MIDLAGWAERLGDLNLDLLFGVLTGLLLGFAGQRSTFCLRSAMVELSRGQARRRFAIWLLAFGAAILAVQAAALAGWFDSDAAQLMRQPGTLSGAAIGGLVFGVGMVMARGCSGRLLILASTGNLRSVTAGLIFALTVQATMFGTLAPARRLLAGLWTTGVEGNVDLLAATATGPLGGAILGVALIALAAFLARRHEVSVTTGTWALLTGVAAAVGWITTYALSQVAFEPITVESATFAAPSANLLMTLLSADAVRSFSLGLIPAVVVGAFLGALVGRELKWEGYGSAAQMLRSMSGGALMGFGGTLAGGCAIGAALSGTAIFTASAWLALLCFFLGAWAGDWIFDRRAAETHQQVRVQR
ncbi:YeeE/YedE family protein [Paracoccus sp. TK19116]|uniref:YeeE/YedE family protein n=1 Tax=Paracoccus albicereus TaxID=2922394 RepID=A0ABT1MSS3_9RHOB|nr:YeeE/YedE family protein [Paracoccus albicereus]MCQ0971370.1 YeeE/YedE family protein [Paracoccus albicereus]